jgi:hypothetical protein
MMNLRFAAALAVLPIVVFACSSTTTTSSTADGGSSGTSSSSGTSGTSGSSGSSSGTSGTSGSSGDSGPPPVCVAIGTQLPDAGVVCTFDGGGPGEAGADGGGPVCDPGSIAAFAPTWIAPAGYHQGKCTADQRATFKTICLGTQADGGAACKAFTGTAAGKACEECILPSTGTALGALLATGGFVSPNTAGCIALVEPCNESCAHDYLADIECAALACNACSKDVNSTTAQINACEATAHACGCSSYAQKAACVDLLTGTDHPAARCLQPDFSSSYDVVAEVFCGP